jgi:hypothetical protein
MKRMYYTLKNVQEKLGRYILKQYKLNEKDQELVIKNNAKLPESYFQHLVFPVSGSLILKKK